MAKDKERIEDLNRQGRRVALGLILLGVFWIAVTWAGSAWDWTQRTRALFDLLVLAGFGWALWRIISIWRQRRND